MWELLQGFLPVLAAGLEIQGPRPKEGVNSSFTSGFGFGVWYALLVAGQVPIVKVSPVEWKKHYGLLKQTKEASILKVSERFPQLAGQSSRRISDGQAEALLIAAYISERVGRPEKGSG